MHFVTTARIHSSSLPLTMLSAPLVFCGGWNATLRPFSRGSCFASASRLARGSREKGTAVCGPTELRGGIAIDPLRVLCVLGAVTTGTGTLGGDCALGRLIRFSERKDSAFSMLIASGRGESPGGITSGGAFRSAINTPRGSSALSIALWPTVIRGVTKNDDEVRSQWESRTYFTSRSAESLISLRPVLTFRYRPFTLS